MNVKGMIANLGYLSFLEFTFKFILPIVGVCAAATATMFYMQSILDVIPFYLPYLIISFGVLFIVLYPYISFERKKIDINNNMHYFITYMGSIATLQLTRTDMFKHLSTKESFGEISHVSKKILYLAKAWNLGYAHTCRKIAAYSPSPVFADFLDRFAAIMDFGQNMEVFLIDEQSAVLEDYGTVYKKSLENIKMLQEVFISMTIASGFAMSISLLLPLVMGISVEVVVRYSLIGVIVIDLFLYFLIKSIIPSDTLCHKIKIKSEERRRVEKVALIVAPITIATTTVMILLRPFAFLVNIGIAILPLLVVGYFGTAEEKMIFRRDKAYPPFARTLGGVIEIKEGAVVSSISALRVHDFGTLNKLVTNAYRRLRLGCDKFQTWVYFAGESGSNLIQQFTQIFSESIYLGGNGEKIGELIATNFNKLLALRRLRIQLATGLKGAFYGALVGFAASAYITAKIAQTLSVMFSSPFQVAQESGAVSGVFGNILPPAPAVNLELVMVYIGLMVIVHALICSLTVKVIDGGSPYAFFQDFVLMIWVGAIISVTVPRFIAQLLPEQGSMDQSIEEVETLGMALLLPINLLFTRHKLRKQLRGAQQ
jgi:flagellar protein FlaJ